MYQSITIVGNLGSDPDMRTTPSGKFVTSFSVAVNEGSGDKKNTTWFKVSCWDKLAETTMQYLTKGRLVLAEGRVKAGAYIDKDGKAVGTLDMTAHTVKFLGGNGQQGDTVATGDGQVGEGDIPF